MTTLHIPTDYGILSVVNRKGYYYAVRTVNQRKRQIYLGKSIPADSFHLNEIAKDIFSNDREWSENHPSRSEKLRAKAKDTKSLSLREDLLRVAELAKALGESRIEQELRKAIKMHLTNH
ncbi:MAG: hypothetical protein ACKPB7_33615 [Sphaerospermopsis kisseleviana]